MGHIQLIGALVVNLRLAALSLGFGLILQLGVALYNDVPGILPGIQTMRTSKDSIRGLHHASPSLETLDYCIQSHIDQPPRQPLRQGVVSFLLLVLLRVITCISSKKRAPVQGGRLDSVEWNGGMD